MKSRTLSLLLVLALVSSGFGPSHQKIVDRTTASIVRITGEMTVETLFGPMHGTYVCSGFVIGPSTILTAAHCLGDNMRADGYPLQVLKYDHYYDLAVLQAPTDKKALEFEDTPLRRGDRVTAIGYGFGLTQVTVVEGTVMLVGYQIPPTADESLPPLTFVQGEYIGGMSGGPVIDTHGRIVGIVQMSVNGAGLGVGTLLIRAFLLGV